MRWFSLAVMMQCVVFAGLAGSATADVLVLSDPPGYLHQNQEVELLEDPSASVTTPLEADRLFQSQPSPESVNGSRSHLDPFWLRYQVRNNSSQTSEWFLDIWAYPMERLQFYSLKNGEVKEEHDLHPQAQALTPYPGLKFKLPPGEERTLLLRIVPVDRVRVPTSFFSVFQFERWKLQRDLWNGVFFGVGIALALYNLFLFLSIRDRSYLYYVLYATFSWSVIYGETGYLDFYFPFKSWTWRDISAGAILLMIASALIFGQSFLGTRKRALTLHRLATLLTVSAVALAVYLIIAPEMGLIQLERNINDAVILASTVLLMAMGVQVLRKGYLPARFYLVAWAGLYVSAVVWVLEWRGILPTTITSPYRIAIGLAFEMILMSWGLADRLNRSRRRYEEALARHSEDLKTEVAKQTLEIEHKNVALIQSAKMAALGEMAGGMAHEINNPLAAIENCVSVIKRLHEVDRLNKVAMLEYADRIHHLVARIAAIIRSLGMFARQSSQDPFQVVPVQQIIDDTLELCRERFRHHQVKIQVVNPYSELTIECRPTEISQVLLNLLSNAFHAIENRLEKQISIEVVNQDAHVSLKVSDSGPGVPEGDLQKIFQPFFTTKPPSRGTGLGLSISKGLIETHNGRIHYEHDSSSHAFVVTLPKRQIA